MSSLLFLALVGVYVLGIAGVVFAGSSVDSPPEDPRDLEDRLALVRETTNPNGTLLARRPARTRRRRETRRRANTARSLVGAIESIARAFTPVVTRRMSSDVATSGSLRSARPH